MTDDFRGGCERVWQPSAPHEEAGEARFAPRCRAGEGRTLRCFAGFIARSASRIPAKQAATLAAFATIASLMAPVESWAQSIVAITAERLRLSSFDPPSIGRGEYASAEVHILYAVELHEAESSGGSPLLPNRGELISRIREQTRQLYVINRLGGDDILPVGLTGIRHDEYQLQTYGSGIMEVTAQITVPGNVVPLTIGFFGQQLLISVVDNQGTESNTSSIRVSGLTSQEKLWGIGILAYLSLMAIAYGILRYRRARREFFDVQGKYADLQRRRRGIEEWVFSVRDADLSNRLERPVPEIPDKLVDALLDNNAVLGLGPGLSIEAGVPSLRETIIALGKQFETDLTPGIKKIIANVDGTLDEDFDVDQSSVVIEALIARVGRAAIVGEIRNQLKTTAPATAVQRRLVRLPWRGLISLTWDSLGLSALRTEHAQRGFVEILPSDGERL